MQIKTTSVDQNKDGTPAILVDDNNNVTTTKSLGSLHLFSGPGEHFINIMKQFCSEDYILDEQVIEQNKETCETVIIYFNSKLKSNAQLKTMYEEQTGTKLKGKSTSELRSIYSNMISNTTKHQLESYEQFKLISYTYRVQFITFLLTSTWEHDYVYDTGLPKEDRQ